MRDVEMSKRMREWISELPEMIILLIVLLEDNGTRKTDIHKNIHKLHDISIIHNY